MNRSISRHSAWRILLCGCLLAAITGCGATDNAAGTETTSTSTPPAAASPTASSTQSTSTTSPEQGTAASELSRDPNAVNFTVPNPPPAGYEEALASVTDPTIKRIFADGKLTNGEVDEANNLMHICLAEKGVVLDKDGYRVWDEAHADRSRSELVDAQMDCAANGPTHDWDTMMDLFWNP